MDKPISIQDAIDFFEKEEGIINLLKACGLYKNTRGKYAGTWFTPLLAIDIVGWLDPAIKLHFNKLILQELFKHRITISDKIRKLTDKIVERFGKQEAHYYMMLNYHLNLKVYGSNHSDIRNESTKEEYDKMVKIIDKLVMMIEEEMFTTAESIINKIQSLKTA
jgi:hypothetical protein